MFGSFTERVGKTFPALASALALTLLARPSHAERPRVVEFVASEPGCPDAGFIENRFRHLVGEDVESPGRAVVTLSKTEGDRYDFLIHIENGDESGERRFSATSCTVGAETAALIIAISLFPEQANDLERRAQHLGTGAAANQASPRTTTPLESVGTGSPGQIATPVLRAGEARSEGALRGTLALGIGLDTTSMPNPGVGFGAAVGLEAGRFWFELTGAAFLAQTVELSDQRGARFFLATLGAHACYAVARGGDVSVSPCLGMSGLRLAGEGFGAQRNFERAGLFGGMALGSALRWRANRALAIRIYAESFVSLARPRFELESQFVHRPAVIGLSAFVGPELRF